MAWGFGKDKTTRAEGGELRRQAQSADRQSQFVEAFDLWLRLAEAQDPEAAFNVGDRYERGSGVLQSFTESALWFQRAADLGWEAAYGKLGDLYFSGRTAALTASIKDPPSPAQGRLSAFASLASKSAALPADYVEAAKWNLKAADLGDPKAQVRLAYQYASKLGVPEDFAAAEWWFSEAASRGEPSGQLGVGMILAGGHGRRKDTATAAKWFEKAAAQGNANAKVCLAVLLTQDDVVERNPQKAVTLLAQAAETRLTSGHVPAGRVPPLRRRMPQGRRGGRILASASRAHRARRRNGLRRDPSSESQRSGLQLCGGLLPRGGGPRPSPRPVRPG